MENHELNNFDISENWWKKLASIGTAAALMGTNDIAAKSSQVAPKTTSSVPSKISAKPAVSTNLVTLSKQKPTQKPTKKQTSKKTKKQKTGTKQNALSDFLKHSLSQYISHWEGFKNKMYYDSKSNPTIGIGHHLTNDQADKNKIQALFGDSVDYGNLLSGKQSLTDEQVNKLFYEDIKEKQAIARRKIKDFDKLNQPTKNAIINSYFRGDMKEKVVDLINLKKWKDASIEYLKHKNAIQGDEQVRRRMRTNALLFYRNEENK